ncbi:MAG: PQQ-binding-like beta-propeller repeat protein [Actinomycetota bacterium]
MSPRTRLAAAAGAVVLMAAAAILVVPTLLDDGASCEEAVVERASALRVAEPAEVSSAGATEPAASSVEPLWALTYERDAATGVRASVIALDGWTVLATEGEISRVDPDGSLWWSRTSPPLFVPMPLGDELALAWSEPGRWGLVVLDAGGQVTTCRVIDGALDEPVPVPDDGHVELVERDGAAVLRRIEADGSERWSAEVADRATVPRLDRPLFAVDGLVVLGGLDEASTDLLVARDDRTGEVRWSRPRSAEADWLASILGGSAGDLHVAVGDTEARGRVLTLDAATGEERWSSPVVDIAGDLLWGTASREGEVLVVSGRDRATGLDVTTGEAIWTVDGFGVTSPFFTSRPVPIDPDRPALALYSGPGTIVDLSDGSHTHLLGDPGLTGSGIATQDGVVVSNVLDDGRPPLIVAWELDLDRIELSEPSDPLLQQG